MDRGAWWARVHGVARKSDTAVATEHAHLTASCILNDLYKWLTPNRVTGLGIQHMNLGGHSSVLNRLICVPHKFPGQSHNLQGLRM